MLNVEGLAHSMDPSRRMFIEAADVRREMRWLDDDATIHALTTGHHWERTYPIAYAAFLDGVAHAAQLPQHRGKHRLVLEALDDEGAPLTYSEADGRWGELPSPIMLSWCTSSLGCFHNSASHTHPSMAVSQLRLEDSLGPDTWPEYVTEDAMTGRVLVNFRRDPSSAWSDAAYKPLGDGTWQLTSVSRDPLEPLDRLATTRRRDFGYE